ncbi:MAG: hypothetical protein IPO54_09690 [Micavibrio sp.]|nr:hypothetical protein [Micavibrio sp.]
MAQGVKIKSVEIKSADEARQHIEKLQAEAKANSEKWSDTLKLKPAGAEPTGISVIQPDGSAKNYQLWMYNGELTVFSRENLNRVYSDDILKGVIEPINSSKNPITGKQLGLVSKGDSWVSEKTGEVKKFDVVQVFVDFDAKNQKAKIVKDLSEAQHGQKWWFQKGMDLTPGKEYGVADRIGVHKTITTPEGKFKLQDTWGYDDPNIETLQTQAGKITDAFQGRPREVLTMTQEVFDVLPADKVKKNIAPLPPQAAAAPKIKEPDMSARPSPPERVVRPEVHERRVPESMPHRAPIAPKVEPSPAGRTAAGVSEEKMKTMMPPAQVTNVHELNAALKAAERTLREIHMAHRSPMYGTARMSGEQIEDVLSHHKDSPFGKILQAAYDEMKVHKDNATQIYSKGTGELGKSYHAQLGKFQSGQPDLSQPREGIQRNEPKPELWQKGTEPWMQGQRMFMAQPGNLGATYVMGTSFLGLIEKNPGLIPKEGAETILKSYDEAYPKMGEIMRRSYTDMEAAKTPADRHKVLERGLDDLGKFRQSPTSLDVDPKRAAHMAATAQDPAREPLPETFTRAHDDKQEKPDLKPAPEDPMLAEPGQYTFPSGARNRPF